ncbi:MAG: glycerate kinase [Candidatus Bathyarchaeota archaeon]|nr:glycerate kinase [Candidatus Bathyarchaeota archaeon]
MATIKNKEELIRNGETKLNQKARALALRSLESALNAVDPKQIIKSRLLLKNSTLHVDGYSIDLKKFMNIYVIGGGKASGSMAEALEQVLGNSITNGLVNVPRSSKNKTAIIKLHEASHPIPDEAGVEGTRRMLKIAEQAKEDDLIICLISGGGSSLMPLPHGKISIADKKKITNALLKCGATINEINTIRKHISDFKGGWLAKKAYPATILNLILSDVVGDPLDFIASGPTVPDSTTFSDAIKVLKKYRLWSKAPASIRKVLSDGEKGLIPETPKANDEAFKRVHNVVVGNNRLASLTAQKYLKSEGLNTLLLTSTLEGEARHVGIMLASIVHEVSVSGNPVPKPAGIIAGGETTVTVTGKGLGGRNQEIALAAAQKLNDMNGVVVASLSTDGVDGPTDAAGAIADGKTLVRAAKMGLTPEEYLAENDSYHFFSKLGDLIFTGPTGTNVNDVSVIVAL